MGRTEKDHPVIGDTVYEVTGLIDDKAAVVHAVRMISYRADLDGKKASEKLLKQTEHIEANYEMVEKLLDIGESDDGLCIQVQWLGQPDKSDWTWQPVQELYEDVPDRVKTFLKKCKKNSLFKKVPDELNPQN